MKRIIVFLSILLTLFIVYYDLKSGTIPPNALPVSTMAAEAPADSLQYKTVTVKPGQTVFSIIGQKHIPADQIAEDFEALNPKVKAGSIQAGATYKFPVYPD
ncbi:LysM domain-containing protein [Bacillus swezeyi]|uniref:LysM domain-containing protein n=1 Tax=Bacillus swezeyi TaxID=1925020 RepID=A0A1R1RU92_9BACI|nr:LysM domain-containing protein [Bacillus swezeyi]MEC1261191.1 LysM domain-containing protein [Bacillus swezeyi]MED1739762.1 LysM domain-containing protein [Bacillus swezeyi]MED2929338.1 LysM domain-containing protein [Bacillus swezeyi]MED2941150.1 LysM domain-containing protein [Bacillus swezeyi]MED2963635.1 LysM domain-containing protein [Bacillus swezeyi]